MRRALSRLGVALGWIGRVGERPAGVLLLAGLLALRALDPAPVEALRLGVLDVYQALRPRQPDADLKPVLIVDIDEESLEDEGQWPWPRHRVADLVDRIAAQGAAVIGFDVLFPEADGHSPARLLDRHPDIDDAARRSIAELPDYDRILADSLRRARVVLGMAPVLAESTVGGGTFRYPPVMWKGADATDALEEFHVVLRSIETIDAAAVGHASLVAAPEQDGVVRRVPMAVRVGEAVIPGLALEMLRVGLGKGAFTIEAVEGGVVAVQVGDYRVPTDPDGRAWVPHTRTQKWRFISASRVLAGNVDADLFRGRVVLIGTTALGLTDLNATPVEPAMYGIEVHAELLEAILAGTYLRRPAWADAAELAAAAVAGLAVILLAPLLAARWSGLVAAGLALAAVAGGWAAFLRGGLLLDSSYPVVTVAVVFTAMLGLHLTQVERDRRRLESELELQREQALRLEGEMDAARDIQMQMLPPPRPSMPRPEIELRAFIEPARAVGGDLYDYFFLDPGRLFFLIGDVSGKGAPAALFMSLTQALCRTTATRLDADPDAIFREVNEELSRRNEAMMFVTAFAGILDVHSGEVDYCNAGHEAAWVVAESAPPRRLAEGGGPPLGTVEEFPYTAGRGRLEAGECLLLLTDGVTEATSPDGELYSVRRVESRLASIDTVSAANVVEGLCDDVERFVAGGEPADDLTVLAIRRVAP